MPLNLLHLSDIHFNRKVLDTVHDPDSDVRDQLLLDATSVLTELARIDAIMVTGDIAFGAKSDEYLYAENWLRMLADRLRCRQDCIFVTPGNHDVDWERLNDDELTTLRAQLAGKTADEVDEALRFYLLDDRAGSALLRPLQNYNDFATKFRCRISATAPYWEHDLALDGETLRIRGLNSTWISGTTDKKGSLIVGQTQALCPEVAGVQFLTLCHHPPEWLLDDDAILDALHGRARILLFGHKHVQRYYQVDETLRLTAGAVHPSRKERPWEPRYNILRLNILGAGPEKILHVDVFEREWRRDLRFAPLYTVEGHAFRGFDLRIGKSRREVRPVELAPQGPVLQLIGAVQDSAAPVPPLEGRDMHPGRLLAQRFLRLAKYEQLAIAAALDIANPEDVGLPNVERARQIFRRAEERKALARLWDEVARRTPGEELKNNPFGA